ncbi:MAG TPA: aminotransferase class V-fold PLP-dependent enzyme [Stellaceae bacterium]|jgi:alanine-glyoxylate transaminase/serine-glyoxylate transaminase/serine-pyruvate transaminase
MASKVKRGRHFLHVPGPSNVPDRVLRAMDHPIIDHRSQEFFDLVKHVTAGMRRIFRTKGPVAIYPSSGTGAWEAALLNTLSPGDKVLAFESGQFATLWRVMAEKHGLSVDFIPGDWRHPVDPAEIERRLAADKGHAIKAVTLVHSETSTGIMGDVPAVRQAMDRARHPALLMVDAISSLGVHEYRHDDWGVDVTICGSQKGLMLPPGLGYNAISAKALAAAKQAKLPRGYFEWQPMVDANETGSYPYTPAISMFMASKESIALMEEEGLENIVVRHERMAEATRRAVHAWGLEILCADPKAYANALTAVLVPEGVNADQLRATILDLYDVSLGAGLGKVAGKVFRIGHLGWMNELMLVGAIAGIEMGLNAANVKHKNGGAQAAIDYLGGNAAGHGR